MEKFNWIQSTDADDYNCHWNGYHLRLEKMDYRLWWWRVYFNSDAISSYEHEACTSKNRAMGMAEGCALGHWRAKLPEEHIVSVWQLQPPIESKITTTGTETVYFGLNKEDATTTPQKTT